MESQFTLQPDWASLCILILLRWSSPGIGGYSSLKLVQAVESAVRHDNGSISLRCAWANGLRMELKGRWKFTTDTCYCFNVTCFLSVVRSSWVWVAVLEPVSLTVTQNSSMPSYWFSLHIKSRTLVYTEARTLVKIPASHSLSWHGTSSQLQLFWP